MKLQDKFTFGKFKGETLKYVMENKGSYVGWCIENIPGFKIEPEDIHKAFAKSFNEYKANGYKGVTVHYSKVTGLPSGAKAMMSNMRNYLDNMILGEYC